MGKGANDVLQIAALIVELSAFGVDLTAGVADLQHPLCNLHNLDHIGQALLLLRGILAADRNGVAKGAGITVDTGRNTQHDHLAVFHNLIGCGRNDSIGTDTAAYDGLISKAVGAVSTANCFTGCGNLIFLGTGLDFFSHCLIGIIAKHSGLSCLLYFPVTFDITELQVIVGQVNDLTAGEAAHQILMYRIGHIGRTDQAYLLYWEFLIQLRKQFGEADDGCQRIFLIRYHKYLEATGIADGRRLLCKGLTLRTAQQHGGAISAHKDRALFKLTAPAGQVPAVGYIQLVEIDHGNIRIFLIQELDHLVNSVLCFLFVKIRHNNSS